MARPAATAPVPPAPPFGGLRRSTDDRVVAGVCGGIGARLGVDPVVVRLVVVVLTVANGLGLLAYAVAWVVVPERDATEPGAPPAPPVAPDRALGVGLVGLGVLLLLRQLGLLLPDRIVWPATVAAIGIGLVWARGSESDRDRWRAVVSGLPTAPVAALRAGRAVVLRAVLGCALLVVGLGALLGSSTALEAVGRIGIAVLATALGAALILGPWIVRLWRDLGAERRERIRSEERAEVAAHLHDSVLQTLALIQRHADSPSQARSLARAQERELRAWLYGGRQASPGEGAGLAGALDALASDVEARHAVRVDVVAVGDCAVDDRVEALLGAVREAAVNAARHAGVDEVSVYVEVEDDRVSGYVRDRGTGFDVAAVPEGRLGIERSIVGRLARHGGRAEVVSTPGEGTEVTVEVPR
jgi:signal transduction histidine kinase/phage shock protein PspC (stress-responsive transcriptional regulator)